MFRTGLGSEGRQLFIYSSVAPAAHQHSAGDKGIPQIRVCVECHPGNAKFSPQAAEREREKSVAERHKGEGEGRKGKTGPGSSVRLIDSSPPGF